MVPDPSTNKHPHPLNRDRLLIVINRDTKHQLGKIAGLKRVPPLRFRKPERFRRFSMKSFTVFQAPPVSVEVWFPHVEPLASVMSAFHPFLPPAA